MYAFSWACTKVVVAACYAVIDYVNGLGSAMHLDIVRFWCKIACALLCGLRVQGLGAVSRGINSCVGVYSFAVCLNALHSLKLFLVHHVVQSTSGSVWKR